MRDERPAKFVTCLIFRPQGMQHSARSTTTFSRAATLSARWITRLSSSPWRPLHQLDGFEFYATQTISGTGRPPTQKAPHTASGDAPVMIAWLGNADQDDCLVDPPLGAHVYLPRELHLRNGKIFQRPVPQLNDAMKMTRCTVREERVSSSS